jgi:hypothetical protein
VTSPMPLEAPVRTITWSRSFFRRTFLSRILRQRSDAGRLSGPHAGVGSGGPCGSGATVVPRGENPRPRPGRPGPTFAPWGTLSGRRRPRPRRPVPGAPDRKAEVCVP